MSHSCKKRGTAAPSVYMSLASKDGRNVPDLAQRIADAQRIVRLHVPPHVSLVEELIAERREAARRESVMDQD